MLRVVEVNSWRRLREFLALPAQIYPPSSPWVPPLTLQTLVQLGAPGDKDRKLFLCLDDERVVARLGVKRHGEGEHRKLHFGFFECCEAYPEAARLLIEEAHRFSPELALIGPYNFRMEDPYTGVLVEGFEDAPVFWAAYNPPYYHEYLQNTGLAKVQDLITYEVSLDTLNQVALKRRAGHAKARGIKVTSLNLKKRVSDLREVAVVMNEALKDNWGFEPFTEEQVKELAMLSYLFLDPNWLLLARKEGQIAGCSICLPDYNPWLKESGGRLTPKLLWRLLFRKKDLNRVRAWALGVLPPYRRLFAAPALIWECAEKGRRENVTSGEVAWILESNGPKNAMARSMGGRPTRVHRVLEKPPIQSDLE